jgi:hypothetical protein
MELPCKFSGDPNCSHLTRSREAIYFDGALPPVKRATRVDRLDSGRIQLESYRKIHRDNVPSAAAPALPIDYDRALWLRGAATGRQSTLPAPPFMVPSVIESLMHSDWRVKVHVVPEEADVACA